MKAKDVLVSKQVGGAVVISAECTDKIHFIGSNFPTSVRPSSEVDSFSLAIKKGQKGLVALVVTSERHGTRSGKYTHSAILHFLLPVEWTGENADVDRENPWVPPPDRLGQIYYKDYEYFLTATTGDKVFSSSKKALLPGERRVDVAQLCRYLAGEIELEELEEHAEAAVAEESAREKLARAEAEIKRKDVEYWDHVRAKQEEINQLKEDLARSNDIAETNRIQRNALQDVLTAARTLLRSYESWKFWDRPDRRVWKKILKEKLEALEKS